MPLPPSMPTRCGGWITGLKTKVPAGPELSRGASGARSSRWLDTRPSATRRTVISQKAVWDGVEEMLYGRAVRTPSRSKKRVGTSPAQVRRVEHDFKIVERWGVTGIERWDRTRLAGEFRTDYYRIGWFEPRCGIVQPAKLARGMKTLAEEQGALIYENSPVT